MIKTKNAILCSLLLVSALALNAQQNISYGDNAAAGKYISINGIRHYYEVYGSGTPLLLIHGNSSGIKAWAGQIGYFAKKYKVYAIDNRGRGKSELGRDTLSYMQLAHDMATFIQLMKFDSVYVVGRSDGGIIDLLMGIYYPAHIKKIVAFGANIWPDTTALFPRSVDEVKQERLKADHMLSIGDTSQNWYLVQQLNRMMEFQPDLTAKDLHRISIPVLVMSCDRDEIKEEHTFFIYKNIPFANLCILPDETHRVTRENPALFNTIVDKFLSRPYRGNSARFKER